MLAHSPTMFVCGVVQAIKKFYTPNHRKIMGDENLDFNYEVEEFSDSLSFCDCCHCQEAEQEYHEDLEREYQRDLLEE